MLAVDLRPGPSANVVLVTRSRPVLLDCGSGSRASDARLRSFLAAHGVRAGELACVALRAGRARAS